MAAVVKKPPATTGRDTPTGTPQRPTSRSSTPTSTTPAGAAAPARPRPSRSGTPVSSRESVHQRRQSLFNGSSSNTKLATSTDLEREEAIRAETVAIIEDLKARLEKAETSAETYQRQAEVLQDKLDEAHREQAKLEEKVHEQEEQIESLTNEKRDAARQIREMENIYEAERSAMMKEKEEMGNREEEMQAVIQRLKDSLAQRNNDEDRPTRQSVTSSSPSIESGSFAPPSSIHRSDSRNNSKLLLQKDKLIESLRLELAESQIKLVESQNQGGGRLQEVERLLMEARVANARLMEDNESYQLLLQERTLKGDFANNDFSYLGGGAASANQDALAALEGRSSTTTGTSLADELSGISESDTNPDHDPDTTRRLEAELKTVKDSNKALSLYINKIIERLLQHQGFEHILDQANDSKAGSSSGANTNKELPPAPAANRVSGASLLQRAKTMATGGGGVAGGVVPKPKPRPMSFMQSDVSNPDTAPSIPIGLTRNSSTRRARPMSDQYGAVGAASIVNQMYRGPSAADGPLSPSLRSSQTFFLPQGTGNRSSASGPGSVASSTPTTGVPMSSSGNFPGMRSETSSTSGDSILERDFVSHHSGATSPPRSQHEKEKTTFGGNKPRPLRLVQENAEAQAAANKRSSWMGWAASAAANAFVKKNSNEEESIKE